MKEFFIVFFSQLLAFLFITMNYRAVAHGSYVGTAITDLLFSAVNFGLIKRVANSETKMTMVAYVIGGMIGSQIGILLTMYVKGF